MWRWIKRIVLTIVFLALLAGASSLFVRFEGVQYTHVLFSGYAHPMPQPKAYANGPCASGPIEVITYNIFNGSALVEKLVDRFGEGNIQGFQQWSKRVPEIRERIASYDADLIGLQEMGWNSDLADIVPPDAGYTLLTYKAGFFEYGDSAMLFRTERFELLENGQFWYGPKPELPMAYSFKKLSMIRYCNWAVLREKATGFTFLWANTHFDNARVNKEPGSQVYRDRVTALAKTMPVIATGDFNSEGDTDRFKVFTGADQSPPLLQDAQALAAEKLVHEKHDAPPRPVTDADAELNYLKRIDHILVGGPCPVKVDKWTIDTRPLKDGDRISDHDLMAARMVFGS